MPFLPASLTILIGMLQIHRYYKCILTKTIEAITIINRSINVVYINSFLGHTVVLNHSEIPHRGLNPLPTCAPF